tara:strand:+ start:736 stop:1347 length:612 start_codon:yes stop_codon:yes gene_type:complete
MLNGLPNVFYNMGSSSSDPKFLLAKNIWQRAEVLQDKKSNLTIFDEYVVKNGERPEDIATSIYDNPFYNWTILIINDIVDFYDQWPRSTKQLQEYVEQKYDQPMGTKHYITYEVKDDNGNVVCPAGKIVPQDFQVAFYNGTTTVTANPTVSVSNYQYEDELNSKKERIQIIRPEFIEDFVASYYELLGRRETQIARSRTDISM